MIYSAFQILSYLLSTREMYLFESPSEFLIIILTISWPFVYT